MKYLPFELVKEKNKLTATAPWIWLIDVTLRQAYTSYEWSVGQTIFAGDLRKYGVEIYKAKVNHTTTTGNTPGTAGGEAVWQDMSYTFRLARNTENIAFNDFDYTAFNFELEAIQSANTGQTPQLTLKIANVNQLLRPVLSLYKGGQKSFAKLYLVHADNLALGPTELTWDFNIDSPILTNEFLTVSLTSDNPLTKRFPQIPYLSVYCPWYFTGAECGYTGAETTCNRTYQDCAGRGNVANFGGFIGLQGDYLRIV